MFVIMSYGMRRYFVNSYLWDNTLYEGWIQKRTIYIVIMCDVCEIFGHDFHN